MRMVGNPALFPVPLTGGIAGPAGSVVVGGFVDLDDGGAAVAEYEKVGSAHADVTEFGRPAWTTAR
jgi:hypothetical protein